MTRSLAWRTTAGAARTGAAADRVRASIPFLFAAGVTGLLAADHGGYWPTSWGWSTLVLALTAVVGLVVADERPALLELAWSGALLAVCAWTAASMLWTTSRTQSALEVERSLVYAALAFATLAVVRRSSVAALLWGVWAGTSAIAVYALATRLFPDRLGVTDAIAGYRLSTPVGYWNGLGLLAAIAAVLALGLVVEGGRVVPRVLVGASLPLLLPTLYFTFSRGAWIALAAALVLVVALSPGRLTFVTALVLSAVPSGLAVLLAYHERPLRLVNVPLARAVGAGHTLAWRLALVALFSGAVAAAWALFAEHVRVPREVRAAYAAILAVAVIGAVAGGLVHYGGPTGAFDRVRQSLEGGSGGAGPDVSRRLLTLSSPARIEHWHVAVKAWRGHRVLGLGAGTYAQYSMQVDSYGEKVLDAHNLYLETLAELGLVGLVILGAALALPLVGAARGRQVPLVAVGGGAYAAWLVHAAYDWDWELPAVTLAGFLCAGAVVAGNRRGVEALGLPVRATALVAAVVVGVTGTLGLIGNRALSASSDAASRRDYGAAVSQDRRARSLAPWSSQPWLQLANIRLQQGRRREAVAAYRRAVAKDPRDWTLWVGLASITTGAERARAVAHVRVLAPSVAAAFGARGGS